MVLFSGIRKFDTKFNNMILLTVSEGSCSENAGAL